MDETRAALRRAVVEHNVRVITCATSVELIDVASLVNVYDALKSYDSGTSLRKLFDMNQDA